MIYILVRASSWIFHTRALTFQVIKLRGVVYQFYIAWSIWREESLKNAQAKAGLKHYLRIALKEKLINMLNTKL